MELIERGKDDSNQGDSRQTLESKSKDQPESPLHKMQFDLEEKNSSDLPDQERKAEITPRYDIIFGADQCWI